MDEIAIEIENLCGGYEDKEIFENLSLNINKGSFTALIGPNGSGKSTLLKYLIKELKSHEKTVFVMKEDVSQLKQKDLAKKLSFVGQNTAVSYEFTVRQIVSMGRYCKEEDDNKVELAMKNAGIFNLKDKLVTRLSGGEMQMTMLSRAICQDTDCIVLDEPVNNLDPKHQIMLLSLLKELSDKGKTIICVLHDLNAVLSWCDYCILLKDGHIESMGKTEDVLTKENIERVYEVKCSINLVDGRTHITFDCNL